MSQLKERSDMINGRPHAVVQRVVRDDYIPNVGVPHLHIHKGGSTFTSVTHSHKNLVSGDREWLSAMREVIAALSQATDANSQAVVKYITHNYPHALTGGGPSKSDELRMKLATVGYHIPGIYLDIDTDDDEIERNENAIDEHYWKHVGFLASETEDGPEDDSDELS